ncbi:MAG: tetratricopeptide repeat protein [Microcoleaceae cyanobacterium]
MSNSSTHFNIVNVDDNEAQKASRENNLQSVELKKIDNKTEKEETEFNHFFQRGLTKYEQQNYQGALEEFNQALEINPDHTDAYIYRGDVKEKLEDDRGAIADYNQAINIDATHPKAYYRRGNVLRKVGDNWGAIADYNQAIRLNPNYLSARHRSHVHADVSGTETLLQE